MSVFDNIAKGLFLNAQLPLDAKQVFATLEDLKNLGINNSSAYYYYKYMKVLCQEDGNYYVWTEVDQTSTVGVRSVNFQYGANTVSNGIDYSNRFYNFVLEPESEPVPGIGNPYIIFKNWPEGNTQNYLEKYDIVGGFFSPTKFHYAMYGGGALTATSSWEQVSAFNPQPYKNLIDT